MSKPMIAKYAGTCRGCGESFAAGTSIRWYGRGRTYHARCEDQGSTLTVLSSGAELYQNRRGRCEDAPCCGCCNY